MFALIARTQQTTMLDGYIEYGAGDFDGQSSGHDYMGVSSNPSMNGSSSGPLFTRRLERGREHNCDGNRQSLGAYRRAWTGWPCDSRAASFFCRSPEALCGRPCAERAHWNWELHADFLWTQRMLASAWHGRTGTGNCMP